MLMSYLIRVHEYRFSFTTIYDSDKLKDTGAREMVEAISRSSESFAVHW